MLTSTFVPFQRDLVFTIQVYFVNTYLYRCCSGWPYKLLDLLTLFYNLHIVSFPTFWKKHIAFPFRIALADKENILAQLMDKEN